MFFMLGLLGFLMTGGTSFGAANIEENIQKLVIDKERKKTASYLAQFPVPQSPALADPENASVEEIHAVLTDFVRAIDSGFSENSGTIDLFPFYHRLFRVLRTSKSHPYNWKKDSSFRLAQAFFFHDLYEERYSLMKAFQELLLSKTFENFHNSYVSKLFTKNKLVTPIDSPLNFEFVLAVIPPPIEETRDEQSDEQFELLGSYAQKVSSSEWRLATPLPHFVTFRNELAYRFEEDLKALGPAIDLRKYLQESDNLNSRVPDLNDSDFIDEVEDEYAYMLGRVEYISQVVSSVVESSRLARKEKRSEARPSIDKVTFNALGRIQYNQLFLFEREPFSESVWRELVHWHETPPPNDHRE